MEYYNANQLRASSSAFMWGDIVFTDYKTGCLRRIYLQSKNLQPFVASKYGTLGAENEDRHAARLADQSIPFIRETKVTKPIAYGVDLSGHIDFLWTDGSGSQVVDETKSVSSPTTYRNVVKNGLVVTENLAQLICYMVAVKTDRGRLIYTYYKNGKAADERIFAVTIDDFGRILIDSKPSKFTVHDQLAHQISAARCIANDEVAQRPDRWDAPFVSPCGYCPFKAACEQWDSGAIEGAQAFVNYSRKLLTERSNDGQ